MDTLSAPEHALVESNVAFAKNVSRKFYAQRSEMGIEFEEFYSAALFGLCDAARRFDRSKGENFQTFSFLRIRGAMYDLLRRGGWSTLGALSFFQTAEAAAEEVPGSGLSPIFFRDPERRSYVPRDIFELAGTIDIIEELNLKLWIEKEGDRADIAYSDGIDPETFVLHRSVSDFLRAMVQKLPEKERQVIELYYFEGSNFEVMREHFAGASRSWLSRLHARAVDRLRTAIELECRNCEHRVSTYAQ